MPPGPGGPLPPELELERRREALRHQCKAEYTKWVQTTGIPLSDIATRLGHPDLVTVAGKGKRQYTTFDLDGWINGKIREYGDNPPSDISFSDEVNLPPGVADPIEEGDGDGFEKQPIFKRTKWTYQVLAEMKLGFVERAGFITPEMMADKPYTILFVPSLKRAILVNDQKGNATRVIFNITKIEDVEAMAKLKKKPFDNNPNYPVWPFNSPSDKDEFKDKIREALTMTPPTMSPLPPPPEPGSGDSSGSSGSEKKEAKEAAPPGWETYKGLQDKLKAVDAPRNSRNFIKLFLDSKDISKENNPEWFKQYNIRAKSGALSSKQWHLAPRLVKMITIEAFRIPKYPKGWKNAKDLEVDFGVTHGFIINLAKKELERIEKKFEEKNLSFSSDRLLRECITDRGQIATYISPFLFPRIKVLIETNARSKTMKAKQREIEEQVGDQEILPAPEDWETISTIKAKYSARYHELIDELEERYCTENPQSKEIYKTAIGHNAHHYSLEFQQYVAEEFGEELEVASKGWFTKWEISELLDTHGRNIEKMVAPYRDSNPEFFKNLLTRRTGQEKEHFSPRLIKILTSEYGDKVEVYKNWLGYPEFAQEFEHLGITEYTIKRYAEDFIKKHANIEKDRLIRKFDPRNLWHLSPFLQKKIRERIEVEKDEFQEPPEGWKNRNEMYILFSDVNPQTVDRRIRDVMKTKEEEKHKLRRKRTGGRRRRRWFYSDEVVKEVGELIEQDFPKE